jgi:hypothetical protein
LLLYFFGELFVFVIELKDFKIGGMEVTGFYKMALADRDC